MRVAVCDDDPGQLKTIRMLLARFGEEAGEAIEVDSFSNGVDLLESCRKHYDLVLLDIMMPGMNGLETARELRLMDDVVSIVFITSTIEYAVEGYRVKAFDYILKPIDEKAFLNVLQRVSHHCTSRVEVLVVELPRKTLAIPYSRIEFVEINNKTLRFHLIDRTDIEVYARMADYEKALLEHGEFVKPHRSYLVNMNLMRSLDAKGFTTLTGCNIPIARGTMLGIKEAYMKHLYGAI